MKKNLIYILAIALQIIILFSIIGKYEYIRATGTLVYIETSGYDPTDLFRWDYVSLRYKLSIPPQYNALFAGNQSVAELYIIPKIENSIVTGIQSLSKERPSGWVYFLAKNVWAQSNQKFVIEDSFAHKLYDYQTSWWCEEGIYKTGEKILMSTYSGSISYLTKFQSGSLENGMWQWIVKDVGKCQYSIFVDTPETDKYYVQGGKWTDLETKIRAGGMYAKWKIGSNGFIMFEDLVSESEIK